jgi:hypothetical protein
VSCPFYGYAQIGRHDDKILFPSFGNQCALVTTAHAPCSMEVAGRIPDWKTCDRYDPTAWELMTPKAAEKARRP